MKSNEFGIKNDDGETESVIGIGAGDSLAVCNWVFIEIRHTMQTKMIVL